MAHHWPTIGTPVAQQVPHRCRSFKLVVIALLRCWPAAVFEALSCFESFRGHHYCWAQSVHYRCIARAEGRSSLTKEILPASVQHQRDTRECSGTAPLASLLGNSCEHDRPMISYLCFNHLYFPFIFHLLLQLSFSSPYTLQHHQQPYVLYCFRFFLNLF